ncbi:MAG: hypothetical protein HPY50_04935 [Firmicutes bacterium]|nr:hypothetical protein [Bacillota bacterium]
MYSRNFFNNKYHFDNLSIDPEKDRKYYARKILYIRDVLENPSTVLEIENIKLKKALKILEKDLKITKLIDKANIAMDLAESYARVTLADDNPEVIAQEVGSLAYGIGIPLALGLVPVFGPVLEATALVFKDEIKDFGRYSFGKRYSDSKELYWLLTNPNKTNEESKKVFQIMFKSIRSGIPIPTPFTGPLSYGMEDIWFNSESYKEYQEKIEKVENNYNPDDYITEPIPGIAENVYNKAAKGLNNMGNSILAGVSSLYQEYEEYEENQRQRRMELWDKRDECFVGAELLASGGIVDIPQLGIIGEAGPEAIIPLSGSYRSRALDLYARTGEMLGLGPLGLSNPLTGGVALAGAGGPNINVSGISVNLNGGFDENELALSIGRQIAAKMKRTMENYA